MSDFTGSVQSKAVFFFRFFPNAWIIVSYTMQLCIVNHIVLCGLPDQGFTLLDRLRLSDGRYDINRQRRWRPLQHQYFSDNLWSPKYGCLSTSDPDLSYTELDLPLFVLWQSPKSAPLAYGTFLSILPNRPFGHHPIENRNSGHSPKCCL